MSDLVRINNTILSGNSCRFLILGAPFEGIQALDYEQTRERKKVWGARKNGRPIGRTAGKYEVKSVTMTMLRDSYDVLTTLLTPLGLGSYGDAEFPMIAQYFEPVPPLVGTTMPINVLFESCVIVGEKEGYAEGIDELVTEVTLDCMSIVKNGKLLASVIRSLP